MNRFLDSAPRPPMGLLCNPFNQYHLVPICSVKEFQDVLWVDASDGIIPHYVITQESRSGFYVSRAMAEKVFCRFCVSTIITEWGAVVAHDM